MIFSIASFIYLCLVSFALLTSTLHYSGVDLEV